MTVLLVAGPGFASVTPVRITGSPAFHLSANATYTVVPYASSVDKWNLSYEEFLPAGFNPRATYPLVVYLHGMQPTGAKWVSGGVPSDIVTLLNQTNGAGIAERGLVANASSNGYIMIAPNTRTGDGFYQNTPCGGPQEQDILDAITHEVRGRHVSGIFGIGFSMGSDGILILAGHHHSLFQAIALAGTATDRFAGYAYRIQAMNQGQAWANQSLFAETTGTCGNGPGAGNATTNAVYAYGSVARLDPQNFSGIPIWLAAGGADVRVPTNFGIFPYSQVNSTWVNSTCLTFPGEPANCTTTFWSLHNATPSLFKFRYIYEGGAPHSPGQFDPSDIFAWFAGKKAWGFYTSATVPPTKILPNPHPGS
ncbi:MAG TPA: hypothetical protein VEY07_05475 [Thermoplasmata archaeon]|nr:hypothetical protein [Thermoplasmata archaeon]